MEEKNPVKNKKTIHVHGSFSHIPVHLEDRRVLSDLVR